MSFTVDGSRKNWIFSDNIFWSYVQLKFENFFETMLFEFLSFFKTLLFSHSLFSKGPTELIYHQIIFNLQKQPINGLLVT